MQCMPYTTPFEPPDEVSALLWDGLAGDAELSQVARALGPILAVRLLLPTGENGCRCATSHLGPALVALDLSERALPGGQQQALGGLRPGSAVADEGWSTLHGGTIALTGLDVRITSLARLADGDTPGPIVVTLADLAAALAATSSDRAPAVWTLVVVSDARSGTAPAGWTLVHTAPDGIPVQTGLPVLAGSALAR